jgi:hypothetical protein
MIEKTRIVYKGDKIMAFYYLGFGVTLLLCSVFLFLFTIKIGWFYLAIGLGLISALCLGKGFTILSVANNRLKFYNTKESLDGEILKSEKEYNEYRLSKKALNRRRYIYTLLFGMICIIFGLIVGEKGLAIGTFVPIMLYAGTELGVTLLTEFRLWEYQRQLDKIGN